VRAIRRVAGWVGNGVAGMITSDDWDHSRKFPTNHSVADLVLKVAFVAWVNDREIPRYIGK